MAGWSAGERHLGWANLLRAPSTRLSLLRLTVIPAFCIGLLMCPALWIGRRSYPVAPLLSLLPPIEGGLAKGLYAGLFVLAAVACVARDRRWPIGGFLGITALFCL